MPVDSDTAARIKRANDPTLIRAALAAGRPKPPDPIFIRDTPPTNLLGGYRFPDAPTIEFPRPATGVLIDLDPATRRVLDGAEAIPSFLRRGPRP